MVAQTTQEFDSDVEAFLRRALPHFLSGKSVQESMAAVLDDDARLFTAYLKQGASQYFPTPDERGRSVGAPTLVGDAIASELSAAVYTKLSTPPLAHLNTIAQVTG